MKIDRLMCVRAVTAMTVLAATGAAHGQVPVWQFDNLGSTVLLRTSAFADNAANLLAPAGPAGADAQTVTGFTGGFVSPNGTTSDWGAGSFLSVNDDVLPPVVAPPGSFITVGAGGVVTINGIGSPTLSVFFRTATSFDMFNADGYVGTAFADLIAGLRFQIARNGAAIGNYTLAWTWNFFSFADPQPEAGGDDTALSRGLMTINTGNVTTLFSESFGPPGPLFGSNNGIGGESVLVGAGGSGPIIINIDSRTEGSIFPPANVLGALPEDVHGSEFFATLTIQIVPSPGSGVLLVGVAAWARRRR